MKDTLNHILKYLNAVFYLLWYCFSPTVAKYKLLLGEHDFTIDSGNEVTIAVDTITMVL